MPSLLIKYQSGNKTEKGKILDEIIAITHGKYTTIRTRILKESFPYPDKKLISDFYKIEMNELFPEPILQNS